MRLSKAIFHLICVKEFSLPPSYSEDSFKEGLDSTSEFLRRIENRLDFEYKSVLDIGCGYGSTCIQATQSGAGYVVGVDI